MHVLISRSSCPISKEAIPLARGWETHFHAWIFSRGRYRTSFHRQIVEYVYPQEVAIQAAGTISLTMATQK
jgi:hypothetical protein